MNESISKHCPIFDGKIDIGVASGLFDNDYKGRMIVMENVNEGMRSRP